METYLNLNGDKCVVWTDEQGMHSMLKSAYDEMQVEHLTGPLTDPTVEGMV